MFEDDQLLEMNNWEQLKKKLERILKSCFLVSLVVNILSLQNTAIQKSKGRQTEPNYVDMQQVIGGLTVEKGGHHPEFLHQSSQFCLWI